MGTSELWREFAGAPYTHPQIPYVGQAGQRGGAERLPDYPVVADVREYGAVGDGVTDDAPAINRALAAAGEQGGGTVTVPPGRYLINDVIRIGHSGVVLRGAGSDRTTLYAPRDLTELIGPYGPRDGGRKSSWSWAGGLLWLCPQERWTALTDAIRAGRSPHEGWTGNERDDWRPLTALAPAARGDRTVGAADVSALRPGRLVLLQLADDTDHTLLAHMAGDGPGTATYDWAGRTKLTSYPPYEWPVRIVAVDADVSADTGTGAGAGAAGEGGAVPGRVTLERPLPLDARPEWSPQLTTLVTPLTGSGVEALTLEAAETPQPPHLLDTGHNGVVLQCAYDCWADDIAVRHVDNGFGLVAASACTLRRTRVAGRGAHHPYYCREGSHDNLVEDFVIERRTVPAPEGTQLHGVNVEGLSSYNVWSRGRMETGTFDTHRGLPFAAVRTEVTVANDGRHGGDGTAGPLYGARFVHWNITVTNERAGLIKIDKIAPYSATVGISEVREFDQIDVPDFEGELHTRSEYYGSPEAVSPANLYEAQRTLLH